MNLDFDAQLQVALRALEEVVAPALGGAEKHVVEQFHLALLTIGFVKTRLPDVRRYARMELAGFVALADQSAACAGDCPALTAAAENGRAVLASAEVDTAEIEQASRRLRDEVAALGSNCQDSAVRSRLDRLVVDHATILTAQARQWAMPFGFELKPEELAPPAW
ncbi:MAG: hypothetical protein KGL44_06970 [Sphingomonadales bacterium]|nr:hypothetical protein [Sphingomonadales bacterium]